MHIILFRVILGAGVNPTILWWRAGKQIGHDACSLHVQSNTQRHVFGLKRERRAFKGNQHEHGKTHTRRMKTEI